MQRIKFPLGGQREFLGEVIKKLNSPSLRAIKQFGIDTKYSALKNYYTESRLIPQDLYETLCHLARIEKEDLKTQILENNWGQKKGGKKGIMKMRKKHKGKLKEWRGKGGKQKGKNFNKNKKQPK